jgi:general secretion pathway protein E
VLPLADRPDALILAMADPLDRYALDAIQLLVGKPVKAVVAVPAELERALARLYGDSGDHAEVAKAVVGEAIDAGDVQRLRDQASEAPVVRLVNALIAQALEARASDIHIEPFEGRLRMRLRIDGVLRDIEAPPVSLAPAITSRVKIMAALDIAERRLPQDGRLKATVQGRDIDLRVSCVPTLYGESVVLRLLDKSQAPLELAALGFAADLEQGLGTLLALPNGILLVTGPTGSGKTTTLYAALQRLNRGHAKILTAEDPVEYQLEGINQVQVRPKIGLDFAAILRSLLRQDPDIILVGEVRDRETAAIAVQSALTGHLVLSTLHTNDAAGAITRLIDMGVEPFLLTSTVRGILAQRLVRLLCPDCKEPYAPSAALAAELPAGTKTLHRAKGCPACNHSGYRGRAAVAELLVIDDDLRGRVLAREDAGALHAAAAARGMRPLRDDGLRLAASGATSIEEVLRVTQRL